MKRLLGLALLLLVPVPVCGQEISLDIKGGNVKVIQVEKVVIVKEDRMLVTAFPFTVNAPPGDGFFFWTYPAGVVAVDKGEALQITSAPKGNLTVSVKMITADWDAKKFVTKFGSLTLIVGESPPGPPPVPPPDPPPPGPPPVNPLASKLKAALIKDGTAAANKALVAKLVGVATAAAKASSGFATLADAQKYWADGSRAVTGITGILSVRQEISNWLVGQFPWPSNTVLTERAREMIANEFLALAAALEEASK